MHMAFFIWWSQVSSVADLGFWISVRNGQNYCSSFHQNLRFVTPSVLLVLEMGCISTKCLPDKRNRK